MSTATELRVVPRPTDPVFDRWAGTGLVWLPEHGMGRLVVRDFPYDEGYFRKYQRYAATDLGARLTELRIALLEEHAPGLSVVDIGIGAGAFVEAVGCYGYDVSPVAETWLKARNLWRNPRLQRTPVATFWDTLEHIPDPAEILDNVADWVFCSLPIVQNGGPPTRTWRHYRTDEHCWYWTRSGFVAWMRQYGFALEAHNTKETDAGREDIETFAFRRVEP